MGVSANHHYVPQGILRNFCFEGESIYYFSRHSKDRDIERRNIKSIFKKRQLNSKLNADGTTSDHLEKFFSKNFDDKIVDFVAHFQHVRVSDSPAFVSMTQHRFFVQCLYNLMKRTPEFHEPPAISVELERIIPAAIEDFLREVRPLTQEEIQTILSDEAKKRITQNARVDVLARQAPEILNLLAKRKVCFAYPRSERKSFIIASQPVVRLTNNRDSNLHTGDVELWVPLTPKFAAGLLTLRNHANVFELSDNAVRHFNMAIAQGSSAIASHSEVLLKSLIAPR